MSVMALGIHNVEVKCERLSADESVEITLESIIIANGRAHLKCILARGQLYKVI